VALGVLTREWPLQMQPEHGQVPPFATMPPAPAQQPSFVPMMPAQAPQYPAQPTFVPMMPAQAPQYPAQLMYPGQPMPTQAPMMQMQQAPMQPMQAAPLTLSPDGSVLSQVSR